MILVSRKLWWHNRSFSNINKWWMRLQLYEKWRCGKWRKTFSAGCLWEMWEVLKIFGKFGSFMYMWIFSTCLHRIQRCLCLKSTFDLLEACLPLITFQEKRWATQVKHFVWGGRGSEWTLIKWKISLTAYCFS